jgi:hypothetical protein
MHMSDRIQQGIFARIAEDHRRVGWLLEQLEATAYDALLDRGRLFATLAQELRVSTRAVDEVVYTTLEHFPATAPLVRVAREENALVEHLLGDLAALHPDDLRWMAKFQVLEDLVERHIESEQGDLFDLASDLIDCGQDDDLIDELDQVRRRELARLGATEPRLQRDCRMLRDHVS